jgi:hypothetical protein
LTFELVIASLNPALALPDEFDLRASSRRSTSLLRVAAPAIGRTLKGIESVFRKGREEQRDVHVCNLSILGTLSR